MGWQLSRKGDQYRIWSTISDQYVTEWISREEVLACWYDDALMQFKKKVIEQYLKFPHFWGNRDTHTLISDDAANERYGQWLHELSEKREEEAYYTFIDETFEKVRRERNKEVREVPVQDCIALIREYYEWVKRGIEMSDETLTLVGYREWVLRLDEMQQRAKGLLDE